MIKIINDFLPKPLFNYLLGVVEHDTLNWNWNDRNLQVNDPTPGGKEVKLGKTLFVDSQLSGMGKEVYDKEIMPLFGVFQNFIEEHMQDKCKPTKMIRMKLNLYPNHGEKKKHGVHTDITQNGRPDPTIVTSVFNFHTCNAETFLLDKDRKEVVAPSVANSIVIFNGTHLHYGTTQTDTSKRIVLNTNIRKAEVDPFGPPDENGRQEFEPLDDYF